MKCPRCGSTKLRKVNSQEGPLSLLVRAIIRPIRCYWCGHEFYRPTALTDDLQSTPSYRNQRRAA